MVILMMMRGAGRADFSLLARTQRVRRMNLSRVRYAERAFDVGFLLGKLCKRKRGFSIR